MLKLFSGSPLPSGESINSQLWQIKPSQPLPLMAFPLFLVLEALSKQNDLKRHKRGLTCSLDSRLFYERRRLPGFLFASWLILQCMSLPCPLSAGSLGPSGQGGPSLTPPRLRCIPVPARLLLTVWVTRCSRLQVTVAGTVLSHQCVPLTPVHACCWTCRKFKYPAE